MSRYLNGCFNIKTSVSQLSIALLIIAAVFIVNTALAGEPAKAKAPCAKHNVLVKKVKKLNKAFRKACPGSVIRLAEGVWKNVVVTLEKSGSEDHPITIKADKPGQTFIEGKSSLIVNGSHVHIEGLVFRNGSPANKNGAIVIYKSHNRLSEVTIDSFDLNVGKKKTPWVTLFGFYHDFSRNHLKNKNSRGVMLIVIREDDRPQHNKIRHNHFENFSSGKKENGWETIRVGTSEQSTTDSYTLIENNRFDQCDGEIEIVSIKSGKNTIRGNTFVNSEGHVTLRHGIGSVVENNIFLVEGKENGGGVRIYDKGHIINNNYFSGIRALSGSRGGVVLQSGTNIPGTDADTLNSQWTAYDISIKNNTFYDSNQNYVFDGKRVFPAKNVSFKGNVIVPPKGFKMMRVDKVSSDIVFEDEYYSTTSDNLYDGKVDDFKSSSGMTFSKLFLEKNPQGLWLHKTLGAQNLKLLSKSDVGPISY